jgi:hypothetical protein
VTVGQALLVVRRSGLTLVQIDARAGVAVTDYGRLVGGVLSERELRIDDARCVWTLRFEHPRLPGGAVEATTDIANVWGRLEQARDVLAAFVGEPAYSEGLASASDALSNKEE